MSDYIHQTNQPSMYKSNIQSMNQSTNHPSAYKFIHPYNYLFVHPSVCPFLNLFIHPVVFPGLPLSIYVFTHPSGIRSSLHPTSIHLSTCHLPFYQSDERWTRDDSDERCRRKKKDYISNVKNQRCRSFPWAELCCSAAPTFTVVLVSRTTTKP